MLLEDPAEDYRSSANSGSPPSGTSIGLILLTWKLQDPSFSMDYRRCISSGPEIMATEVFQDVSVTDVYDQAAGIAREFDKLISSYGSDAVTELMPKVIRALEQLECLASRFEKDNEEIANLRSVVEKLESEKADKAQERAKFEQVS